MSASFRFDPDDPFGSRADEKPPAGWQEGFWDQVRERIERSDSRSAGEPPPPEPRSRRGAASAVVVLVLLAVTVVGVVRAGRRTPASPSSLLDPATTHVRVNGSRQPVVAVEWARSRGESSGYVVLHSIDPDIAWVVLEERPPESAR